MESETARVLIEVLTGVIPGQPMHEHTRRFAISSREWEQAGPMQADLLVERNQLALTYAADCMARPDRFNWVRTDWIWL